MVSESDVLSYLLHGGPSLSEWSGETVRERATLSTDVGLNLHSYRVAKPQGVGGLKRKIPADKTSVGRVRVRKKMMQNTSLTCFTVKLGNKNIYRYTANTQNMLPKVKRSNCIT